jgi:hypothetical protein
MALQRQSNIEEWLQLSPLAPLLFSSDSLPDSPAGLTAGIEAGIPCAALPHRAGASDFEGKGGASERAAACLEGVAPRVDVVDVEAAATEALRKGIARPLMAPLPGVVCTGFAQGIEIEELTDRYRHARTALAVVAC